MSGLTRQGDPLDDPLVQEQLDQLGTTDTLPLPGKLDHLGGAFISGFPRGFYEGKAAVQKFGGAALHAAESAAADIHFASDQDSYEAGLGDAGFERFRESEQQRTEADTQTDTAAATTSRIADNYRPDPITTGAAGQVANELSALLPRTIAAAPTGPAGMAIAAGAPSGLAESQRLQREGVDADTANTVGTVTGVTTGIGAILPAGGFASGAATDATLALAGNLGLGAAQRGATGKLLTDAGYPAMGAQYDAFDKTAMTTDAAFSLLLTGAHRLGTADADAAMTNRLADQAARGDGVLALDPRSGQAHDAAKTDALGAVVTGNPVEVAQHVTDAALVHDPFHPDAALPEEVTRTARSAEPNADAYDAAAEWIIGLESGGKADAKNPRSSATGAGQFIAGTWLDLLHRARPDLVAGHTEAQLLAMRTDPDLSRAMVTELARENGAALEKAGLPVTPANLYALHHFGQDAGIAFAKAAGDTPMDALLSEGKIKANPYLKGLTKDQLLANWKRRNGMPDEFAAPRPAEALADERPAATSAPEPRDATEAPPPARALLEPLEGDTPDSFLARAADAVRNVLGLPPRSEPLSAPTPEARPMALPDDPTVQLARHFATQAPDEHVFTGYSIDGAPVYQPMHQAVAALDAEHTTALREADGYAAAATCFARTGEPA